MIDRRHLLQGTGLAAVAALGGGACARTPDSDASTVRYWGMGAAVKDKDEAVKAAFLATDAGRGVEIHIDQVPSSGAADMSQIITAVRGGTAPDLWWMDRFNAVLNASIGLLEPLDDLIEEYEGVSVEEFTSQWLQFAIDELTYEGSVYGLPTSTDARGLLCNQDVLQGAGEEFPFSRVDAFYATYQPPNAPPSRIALFSQRLAITATGPWQNSGNRKYAPDLPLTWTWLPVAEEGDPTYTWSGGFSLVMPKGSSMSKAAWDFMTFHTGLDGQRSYVPELGSLPTHLHAIEEKAYDPTAELFRQMLPGSTSRPPLPVGSVASDAMDRAKTSVALGSKTPQQVLEETQAMVVPKMDLFPGFRMPETYGERQEIEAA
ncbi:hypothetical protein C1N80_10005 [Brachybacterium sp. SGAir0954]|uniref:extracellular solute-binding protein n=1 Tax=Brachybacterium sp. SGAir0954 TaxID=2571029 RepID=UPI0010CCEEA7|nr:extracellular solute-binding protein [Brachybacterium sp. SGAir0954]QCR53875.1 hypothetical protein C1N80_10005 [Brachybacterium sp. SGAir0954]